jgi:hypothetical protein
MIEEMLERIKRRKKFRKENSKRYWEFAASERLHYDSLRNKIIDDNEVTLGFITIFMVKLFFFLFAFLFMFKFLLDLDGTAFAPVILALMKVFTIIIKVSLTVDVLSFLIIDSIIIPRKIRRLNKIYGFKVK